MAETILWGGLVIKSNSDSDVRWGRMNA